jgi:uncharacterized damage-inducible protein DinB
VRAIIPIFAFAAVLATSGVQAQTTPAPPANPLSAGAKRTHGVIKDYITRAAEKMPEEQYAFEPTPDVRSFGQLIGHIADSQYGFCSVVKGEKPPVSGIEKTKTTKADLQKALAEAFAYCDAIHASMTDAVGAEVVAAANGMAKLSILEFNTHHNSEHYGNLVTYMRLKGLVPPSSEPKS